LGLAGGSVTLLQPQRKRTIQIVLIKYRMVTGFLPIIAGLPG